MSERKKFNVRVRVFGYVETTVRAKDEDDAMARAVRGVRDHNPTIDEFDEVEVDVHSASEASS